MTIDLSAEVELALRAQANARGISISGYIEEVIKRELAPASGISDFPFHTGRGDLAYLGEAPSAEEIDQNRSEMFGAFGDNL